MRRLSLAVAALLVSTPVMALPQSTPTYIPRATPPPTLQVPGMLDTNGPLGEIHRQNMTTRARQVVENTSPGRMDRAERAAALINAGDCQGAHALAIRERDGRLASRIAEICESSN